MKSLVRRVIRIAHDLQPVPGCATCRGWFWVVLEGDDGPHRPEQCSECGRVMPATLVVRVEGVAIASL